MISREAGLGSGAGFSDCFYVLGTGLGWAGLSGLEPGWAGLCCGLAGFSAFVFSEWVFRLLLCFGNPGWAWAGGLKGSEDLSPGRAAGSDR